MSTEIEQLEAAIAAANEKLAELKAAEAAQVAKKSQYGLTETPAIGLPVQNEGRGVDFSGPTLLIAAMRCYVASRLGDEVDVPEELLP